MGTGVTVGEEDIGSSVVGIDDDVEGGFVGSARKGPHRFGSVPGTPEIDADQVLERSFVAAAMSKSFGSCGFVTILTHCIRRDGERGWLHRSHLKFDFMVKEALMNFRERRRSITTLNLIDNRLVLLRLYGDLVHSDRLNLPKSLNYQFQKLRTLEWSEFPMTCLPSNFNPEFLVELDMSTSNRVKPWEETQPSLKNLKWMSLCYSVKLMELPDLTTAINLKELDLQGCSSLEKRLVIFKEWRQFSLLPQLPDFLSLFYARVCDSMEGVECSFYHLEIHINYTNCSDLNSYATDDIICASACRHALLPNGAVPAYFTYRATGDSVTVKLDERPFPIPMRFMACILLAKKSLDASGVEKWASGTCSIIDKQTGLAAFVHIRSSRKIDGDKWEIRECGVDVHVDVLHFDE
ncbi:hypothetical protein N665_0044s0010 [Sinapis alba]|nr:hypothetical protein N665_0044s0010 [Sinapis alba]